MKEIIKKEKNKAPKVDLNAVPIMDVHQIMNTLPHRPPIFIHRQNY